MPTVQRPLRICVVYDCLFPHTVGGAERWYRNLAERLAAEGHEVTYLTLRQWDRGDRASVKGVRVVAAGPRMALYVDAASGRRRILPPLVFGAGVLAHLLVRGGRYDVVHTASFPYFSLLAAALVRPLRGYGLVVDWHEVWTRAYWREYVGALGGLIGWAVQSLCARPRQRAFCFSRLHAARVREIGLRGDVTVLEGEYAGQLEPRPGPEPRTPLAVFAGRHIPEKRVIALIPALARARRRVPNLRARILGDGPDRSRVVDAVRNACLEDAVDVPGFVAAERVDEALAHAEMLVLPSSREGYGMVVVEASSRGTPSIVVAAPDNAATELIEDGVNGVIATSVDPSELADAIVRVHEAGPALRARTADWFARSARRLSMSASLETVARSYRLR
jgi:glycosyltransferase involved in cell wall biosynthesis